jgi:hypothetical protein
VTATRESLSELLSERISRVRSELVAELENHGTKYDVPGWITDITGAIRALASCVNDLPGGTLATEYRKESGLGTKKTAREITGTKSPAVGALARGKQIMRTSESGNDAGMISGAVKEPTKGSGTASVAFDLKKVISGALGEM